MSFTLHYCAFGVVRKSTFWGKIFQQKIKKKNASLPSGCANIVEDN